MDEQLRNQAPMHRPRRTLRSRWLRLNRNVLVPWLFILPILLVHIFVVAIPSFQGLYFSLTDWNGIGKAEFIGLENFRTMLFDDSQFIEAVSNNLTWLAFFLTVPFFLALLVSSLLAKVQRFGMLYRTALFIPYLIPSVVTTMIWRNLMNPRTGVGGQLKKVGIDGLDIAFLGRPDTALLSVAFIDNWHYWGFLMILFLTAMQSIPPSLYDAAKIDGATQWQEFRYVTLPGIRPVVVFMLMMTAIWSFLVFEYVWILTQGGPAGSTEVLGTLIYKNAFTRFEAGYAAAQGIMISLFAGFVILIFLTLRRLGWDI